MVVIFFVSLWLVVVLVPLQINDDIQAFAENAIYGKSSAFNLYMIESVLKIHVA